MFRNLYLEIQKYRLKDNKFICLFDNEPVDEVVVFDTETTGLDPNKDNILSIGAVKVVGNKILSSESFEVFVKQSDNYEGRSESIKIHKIRDCDLKNGILINEAIDKFINFIGSRPLVGYYLEFDISMINKYFKKMSGISLPNREIEVSALYHDMKIGRIPQSNVDLRLSSIIADLKIPTLTNHDALSDAVMTAMIYLKLKNNY